LINFALEAELKGTRTDRSKFKFAKDCMQHWQQSSKSSSYPVIFDSLRSISDNAKVSEAMDILIAGADTTASTLTTGFYHILTNLKYKERLVRALDDAIPEAGSLPSLQSLEKVEYLVCKNLV
jgi:hypothetical protein